MNETQLELTRLLGDKTISFGCLVEWDSITSVSKRYQQTIDSLHLLGYWDSERDMYQEAFWMSELFLRNCEIIWHPATLTDFHKWMMVAKDTAGNSMLSFRQNRETIAVWTVGETYPQEIDYDSSLQLLEQSPETLSAILNLVKFYDS